MKIKSGKIVSFVMLLVGALLVGFSMGRWLAPLAAWIGPVLIMRYARDHRVGRGYLLVLTACILAVLIGFLSIWLGGLPTPMVPFLVLGIGLLWSLPYLADRLMHQRLPGFWSTLAFPLAATALEFLIIHFNPLGTWGAWGFTQYGNLPLMQLASVTGMIGITFLMAWTASVANWAWETRARGGEIRWGLAALGVVFTTVFLFGYLRLDLAPTSEVQETVRVAGVTVEGLDSFAMRMSEAADADLSSPAVRQGMQAYWDAYFDATVREAQAGAQVIVWPEMNGVTLPADEASLVARAQDVARQNAIYLAVPVGILDPDKGQWKENKLLLIDPTGAIVMEHVKYGGAIIETSLVGDGKLQTVATPFGVLSGVICYDLDYPAVIQQAGRNGTGLLLAPSKDWFEIDPVHSHMAVFRAIENGMSLVRQTDAGLSIAVDPYGRVLAQKDFFGATDRTMVAQVPVQHVTTIYSLFGRWFEWVCLAGFFFVVVWAAFMRRQGKAYTEEVKLKGKISQLISMLVLATLLVGAVAQPGLASAAARTTAPQEASTQLSGPIAPQDMETLLDELIPALLEEHHVPGFAVSVVKDGTLFLAKGYGYADLEGQVPVDPERTLFRVASISKLFTWTAVMQLVEQGKLSLDTDVNEYLDFAIPATYLEPITLRHLLSHTAGFEKQILNMWKLQAGQVSPLGEYLRANLPARVFPPGEVIAYSNYGASLAGYIVERVSGLPFSDYVDQNLLAPLGMAHSTFRQPLPEALAADLALGYNYTKDGYVAGGFVFGQSVPASSMSATATDIARFMIAHLQNGELDGERILQEDTARQMHAQLYTPDPRLGGGMAHGFFEDTVNGQRILSHGASIVTFQSLLFLIPEQNVGVFLSTNSTSGGAVNREVSKAFMDRYYPPPEAPQPQSAAGFAERIAPYLGEYTASRSNFTTSERTVSLSTPVRVSLGSDGILEVLGLRFTEVEPGLLQGVDDPAMRMVYRTGPGGRPYLMGVSGLGGDPFAAFKTPWYGTGTLHMVLFSISTLLFLCAVIGWPIGYLVSRRRRPAAAQPRPLPGRLARWAAALFGLLWLVALLGLVSIFADILPGYGVPSLWFGTPPQMTLVFALAYGLGALALAILVFAVVAWLRRYWSLGGRIFYSVLALVALLLTWSLVYWNLLL